jgi:hypothetical protein
MTRSFGQSKTRGDEDGEEGTNLGGDEGCEGCKGGEGGEGGAICETIGFGVGVAAPIKARVTKKVPNPTKK